MKKYTGNCDSRPTCIHIHTSLTKCTCVPQIAAAGPGQFHTEGWEKVQEGPDYDDDVGNWAIDNNNLTGITHSWKRELC